MSSTIAGMWLGDPHIVSGESWESQWGKVYGKNHGHHSHSTVLLLLGKCTWEPGTCLSSFSGEVSSSNSKWTHWGLTTCGFKGLSTCTLVLKKSTCDTQSFKRHCIKGYHFAKPSMLRLCSLIPTLERFFAPNQQSTKVGEIAHTS